VTVLLVILYVLVCLFLIMVVLLQQGKGADLAGAFGGGGSQTSFGPRTTTNIMHRMTTGAFVLFVVLCLALAILSGKQRTSVMENVAAPVETSAPAGPALAPAGEAPAENPLEQAVTEEDAGGPMEAENPAVPEGTASETVPAQPTPVGAGG
jgi:preprotein translocase subunit SecG